MAKKDKYDFSAFDNPKNEKVYNFDPFDSTVKKKKKNLGLASGLLPQNYRHRGEFQGLQGKVQNRPR